LTCGVLTTREINYVYVLSADHTSILVDDHEVLRHKVNDHEVSPQEEKECQENLEVQPSKHRDPESMIPNVSEVRPQKI
jgi:hypothetical protein